MANTKKVIEQYKYTNSHFTNIVSIIEIYDNDTAVQKFYDVNTGEKTKTIDLTKHHSIGDVSNAIKSHKSKLKGVDIQLIYSKIHPVYKQKKWSAKNDLKK